MFFNFSFRILKKKKKNMLTLIPSKAIWAASGVLYTKYASELTTLTVMDVNIREKNL
ncbi:MAG: hypothetical protein R2741_06590 [Methanolobus sp.]